MSPITTHVLDISRGRPPRGIPVILEVRRSDGGWTELARGVTNDDGRIMDLMPEKTVLQAGIHRLRFATAGYFAAQGIKSLYPEVHVVFQLDEPAGHYHIPLLLSPYGYSTYRGS